MSCLYVLTQCQLWRRGGRDFCLDAMSSTVGHGVSSHPDTVHVLPFTVGGVSQRGQAMSPSGRQGLTRRPLRSVQEREVVMSLTSRGHVGRPSFDRRRSRFPGEPRPWTE